MWQWLLQNYFTVRSTCSTAFKQLHLFVLLNNPMTTHKEYPANPCSPLNPRAFIFDIDGTLAKMNWRSPYDYTKVSTDLPHGDVVTMCNLLAMSQYKIIVVSWREWTAQCTNDTVSWLKQHLRADFELHMRKESDKRPDTDIKEEIFLNYILPHYNVVGVFDDRNRVVSRWRELGLRCYQVAEWAF